MMFKRIAAALLVVACLIASVGCEKGDMLQTYYGYDVFEYVTLGQYKDLTLEVRDPAPTEAEIQEVIDNFLDANSVIKPTGSMTVRDGDFVKLTYDGYYLGVKRDGLSGENYEFKIGSLEFIEEFEDSAIGKRKGEEYTIEIIYPDDFWNKDLKGQKVRYMIKVEDFYAKEYPEFTDELVYEKLGYSTIENFKTYITEKLTNTNITNAENNFTYNVWEMVLDNATIKSLPQDRMDFYEEQSLAYIKELWQKTFPSSTFDIFIEIMTNKTYDEFMKEIRENCEDVVKDELVLLAIAKTEGIVLEWSDYKSNARNYLKQYNCVSIQELEKNVAREELCLTIVGDIIHAKIAETVTVVTKPN